MKRLAGVFATLALGGLLSAALFLFLPKAPPPALQPPIVGQIERIVVEKAVRRMTLWQNGAKVREYRIALGTAPVGDKVRQGDGKTPEGLFRIDRANPNSAFTLSLGLDYPQPDDRARARAAGYDPGGDIMIHGQPNALPEGGKLPGDWTAGCIALTNANMREVWAVAGVGTVVEVRP